MSRIRDIANILSGGSSSIATDAEITSAISAQFVAGKNKIINGDFGIWQRGTSFNMTTATTYCADRWNTSRDGTGATVTVTRETFAPGISATINREAQYFLRFAQTVAGSGGTYNVLQQRIEDVRTFAGKTVTFSFWAKANVATSIGAGSGQRFGSGGSASVYTDFSPTTLPLTTSWAFYSFSGPIASVSGKTIGDGNNLEIAIRFPSNVVQTIDVWGLQVEEGTVATNFTTATGTIQGELATCQRYYLRQTGGNGSRFALGDVESTSTSQVPIYLPTEMRTAPSISFTSVGVRYAGSSDVTISTVGAGAYTANMCVPFITVTSAVLTVGQAVILRGNAAPSIIEFSSEL